MFFSGFVKGVFRGSLHYVCISMTDAYKKKVRGVDGGM
jgi:hypothetical protein